MKDASYTIFLSGDVMIGRGIDQILPHPSAPQIHEGYLKDARGYLKLAEQASGPIPRPASFDYPWGDALSTWEKHAPDLRVINLETSITTSEEFWRRKGINYRMHPANVPCLTQARIDACTLANNNVLDWGYAGLRETLRTLHGVGVRTAGAGRDLKEAATPARLEVPGGSVAHLFSFALGSSGVPPDWKASATRPGINLLADLSPATLSHLALQIKAVKRENEAVIASLHWGGNWGVEITREEVQFAHHLIEAGADIVHGHSSHHVKAIEVYQGRLVLYGCGDLINDYEGISGFGRYRGELGLMYFARLHAATGKLSSLTMVPTRVKKFRLQLAAAAECTWLRDTLNREGEPFETCVQLAGDGSLSLCLPSLVSRCAAF